MYEERPGSAGPGPRHAARLSAQAPHRPLKSWLARSIGDAAWGELLRQITYKATCYGRTFWQAPRMLASSKTCSACGVKRKALPLSTRGWNCWTAAACTTETRTPPGTSWRREFKSQVPWGAWGLNACGAGGRPGRDTPLRLPAAKQESEL